MLAAELLLSLGKANYQYKIRCNSAAENLLDLAVCIEKKIKEEEDLKHLVYTERDYLGRNVLTIASS